MRLLEPVPRVDGQRLDMLLADAHPRLELAHYMFLLLTATEIELLHDQWHELCLPRRSGPRPTAGSDVANKHRPDLERICRAANLALAVKPKWRIEGQFTVDTRMFLRLVEALAAAVRQREVTRAVKVLTDLRHWGQQLKKDGELPSGWPLAKLVDWVKDTVPKDIPPASTDAEEFRQRAIEVSGLGRLEAAVRDAKTDLPRRVFELLLEEERFDEAADVLTWIDPTYEREHERAAERAAVGAGRLDRSSLGGGLFPGRTRRRVGTAPIPAPVLTPATATSSACLLKRCQGSSIHSCCACNRCCGSETACGSAPGRGYAYGPASTSGRSLMPSATATGWESP